MGISTISKLRPGLLGGFIEAVSIPNGDKHDFKTDGLFRRRRPTRGFNPQWG